MALTKLAADMAIIQKLEDEPNDTGGLSAAELKAKFDEGGEAVKEWINETLIPELEENGVLEITRTDGTSMKYLRLNEDHVLESSIDGKKWVTVRAYSPTGDAGSSAYGSAKEAGYTGTELEFNEALAKMPDRVMNGYSPDETLSGETKTLLGLDETAVPDDAFKAIPQKIADVEPVGTIKTTTRADLGDNWMLCNGDTFLRSEYPELGDTFPMDACGMIDLSYSENCRLEAVYCYEGLWVAAGSDGSSYPCVVVSGDSAGEWKFKRVTSTKNGCLYGVYCHNGTWVAVGHYNDGLPCVFVTNDPTSGWTEVELPSPTPCYIKAVVYHNGFWGAVGYDAGNYPYIYTASAPTGEWTKTPMSGTSCMPNGIACHDGTWVVAAYITGTDNQSKKAYILTATDPTGTWSTTHLMGTYDYRVYDVCYHDGVWIASGDYNGANGRIFIATDPAGEWAMHEQKSAYNPFRIESYNGTLVTIGSINTSAYAYVTTDPTGKWTDVSNSYVGPNKMTLRDICCYNGTWVGVGCYNNSNTAPIIVHTTDPTSTWKEVYLTTRNTMADCLYRCNDLWVAHGRTSNSYPVIRVANDLNGAWKTVWVANQTTGFTIGAVSYHNGVWVAVGNNGDTPCVYYTYDIMGDWTTVHLSATKVTMTAICGYDGTWVAVGHASSPYPYAYVTTDPAGTWTEKQISSSTTNLKDVYCYNGTWVAVGYTNTNYYPYVATTTDPISGKWSVKALSTSVPTYFNSVHCYDGLWVAAGWYGYYQRLWITNDPAGTWKSKSMNVTKYTSSGYDIAMQDIQCVDGIWMMVGGYSNDRFIMTAADPYGTWACRTMTYPGRYGFSTIACHDGDWAVMFYNGSQGSYTHHVLSNMCVTLPPISVADDVYTYIKAKED